MSGSGDPVALAILGPTASGKSRLAVAVARALDGEVVSVDSRQVYRGMDVGTAKPGEAEREGVPHHGFDLVDPDERYSAGRFARDARGWIGDIRARGRVPVLAGGPASSCGPSPSPSSVSPRWSRDAGGPWAAGCRRVPVLSWSGGSEGSTPSGPP